MTHRLRFALLLTAALAGPARADEGLEAQAIAWLSSSAIDEVQLGIEALAGASNPAAVAALDARVQRGLPRPLLVQALHTLESMHATTSAETVLGLLRHRSPEVRAAAAQTLGAFGGTRATLALRGALDDADPIVRIAAAHALGQAADAGAVPVLLRAFDRGVYETAEVIGRIGGPNDVQTLLGHVGHVPLEALLPGLAAALTRADLPQRLRLDVVARLADLGTPSVRVFFEATLPTLPGTANDAVRRAVNDAIVRISG